MNEIIIKRKEMPAKRTFKIGLAIYFLFFCGYFVVSKASVDNYDAIFYFASLGALVSLAIFLFETVWVSTKALFTMNDSIIESRLRKNKFKLEWVKVSRVTINEYSITFHYDGERKLKELLFSNLLYSDAVQIKEKVTAICEYKNIPLS